MKKEKTPVKGTRKPGTDALWGVGRVQEQIALHREYNPDIRRSAIGMGILELEELLQALENDSPERRQVSALKYLRKTYNALGGR